MTQFNDRHVDQPQLAGGGQTTMSGDDPMLPIDEDRISPAVLDDAGGNLGHLRFGVGTGIPGERNQRLNLAVLDVEHVLFVYSKMKRPAQWQAVGWVGCKSCKPCKPRFAVGR